MDLSVFYFGSDFDDTLIKMKFGMLLRYTLSRFVFTFHKIRMVDDVNMTSFKFSTNNCPYLKFY